MSTAKLEERVDALELRVLTLLGLLCSHDLTPQQAKSFYAQLRDKTLTERRAKW